MKILLVQPYALGPGHFDAAARRVCRGFCQLGQELVLMTAAGTELGWEKEMPIKHIEAAKKDSRFVVNLHAVDYKLKLVAGIMRIVRFFYTSWIVERKALQTFVKGGYDVLHFYDCEPITFLFLFLIYGKPKNVFLTVHTPYNIYRKSFYKYFYDPPRRAAIRWLFKYIHPVTFTELIKKSLLGSKLIARDKDVPVIPVAADSVLFNYGNSEAKKTLGIESHKKVFGFFGYLLFHKGFNLLLDVWPLVKNDSVLLALVHTDKPGQEEQIKKKIREENIKNIIIKFAYAPEEEFALNICACDAIILPYVKYYGDSGIMNLACSYKVPLIVSDCGPIGKRVEENDLGILFKSESVLSLKNAIEKFSELDRKNISRMKQSQALYSKSNTWKNFTSQLLSFYQKTINGTK